LSLLSRPLLWCWVSSVPLVPLAPLAPLAATSVGQTVLLTTKNNFLSFVRHTPVALQRRTNQTVHLSKTVWRCTTKTQLIADAWRTLLFLTYPDVFIAPSSQSQISETNHMLLCFWQEAVARINSPPHPSQFFFNFI
jgi:hypothetical protein